jgi:hypothetical protein
LILTHALKRAEGKVQILSALREIDVRRPCSIPEVKDESSKEGKLCPETSKKEKREV